MLDEKAQWGFSVTCDDLAIGVLHGHGVVRVHLPESLVRTHIHDGFNVILLHLAGLLLGKGRVDLLCIMSIYGLLSLFLGDCFCRNLLIVPLHFDIVVAK